MTAMFSIAARAIIMPATGLFLAFFGLTAGAQVLPAFSSAADGTPLAPWRVVGLPGGSPLQQWVTHTRDLRADFLRAFGEETDTVPPLLDIVVGADADNTGGSSLAYVGDLILMEQ